MCFQNAFPMFRRSDIIFNVIEARPDKIEYVPGDYFKYMESKCTDKHSLFEKGLRFIYPGTKWCGPGTVANNYTDLGFHNKEDACCREHDNCPEYLEKGECNEELCNDSKFTR